MTTPKIEKKIISPQTHDMGDGTGEFICQEKFTLQELLTWYKSNSKTWGVFTIHYKDGEILRKFDYDLYNRKAFYILLHGEGKFEVEKALFRYCFMSEEVDVYLDK